MDKAVEELQQELKVLKNEIKETLTDVREVLLNTVENPFPQDLSSRPISSHTPQAAPRPSQAPQQDTPAQQQPIAPPQNPLPQGGVLGGGPMVFGNMGGGGGGYPIMPQMGIQAPMQGPAQASTDPYAGQRDVAMQAPQQPPQEAQRFEQQSNGGPGLPPSGGRRERPAARSAGRPMDGPGLPPGGRDSGPRTRARDEEQETNEARPSRRQGPGPHRESVRRRSSNARPAMRAGDAYEDYEDDAYEEPYGEDDYDEYGQEEPTKGKVDLVVLASLSPWLSEGIRRIGRKRMKAVLDIYSSMGSMTRELKDILVQIVDMDDTEGSHEQVTVQDSMRLLIELDDLMWRGRQDWRRAALMTMLSADEGFRS